MKHNFVYIIYDTETGEIWENFFSEDECVNKFNSHYDGFKNIDWCGINLQFMFKNFFLKRGE